MRIEPRFYQFCAEKTKELLVEYFAAYGSDDGGFWRSADELQFLVQTQRGKQIYCKCNRIPAAKAKYSAYTVFEQNGTCTIIFVDNLDDKETKYFKCKELFQIVLQQDAFRTRDIIDHITNMVKRDRPESADLWLGDTTTAETLAELAAEEFLFPLSHRLKYIADGGDLSGVSALSDKYKIPEYVIEQCLDSDLLVLLQKYF